MHMWLSRAALDLIGQGGIGYSFNALSLDDSNSDPYKDSLKSLMQVPSHLFFFLPLFIGVVSSVPQV